MGDRSLVQSLTTLACQGSRRPGYFRGELMATLKIADRGDIPLDKLKGSWAGAFGQTQFMPSTFLRLAVDLDGSGRDIVDSAAAALGSTGNYLRKSGWRPGEPWGFEVKLPAGYSGPSGRKNKQPMSAWAARGITRIDGKELGEGEAGLLLPAGADGPAFLVTHNFDVIYSYNAAESYTLAAAILAQRLAGGHGIVTPWPTDDPGLSRAERRELQTLLTKGRLRRRRPRRRDRRQDQGGDRRFPGQEGVESGRPAIGEGAAGAEEVGRGFQACARRSENRGYDE